MERGTVQKKANLQQVQKFLQIDWSSNLDGRLTPEDDDWLTFESRLSAGRPSRNYANIERWNQSKCFDNKDAHCCRICIILVLDSPANGSQFASSDTIVVDARNSVDYDDDPFMMTLRIYDESSAIYLPILTDVSTSSIHEIQLEAWVERLTN